MEAPSRNQDLPDPALRRILRKADDADLLTALTERLSPADLTTLLLAVQRHRAAGVSPARLLERHRADRFTAPSTLRPRELALLVAQVHEVTEQHGFAGVELSPLCPLGTNSAVASVDQNKVVATIRNTEVVADVTNVLALEVAERRREDDRRQRGAVTRLSAVHRVVRAQQFQGPGMVAHFALLGMCTGGRDTGSFRFETAALVGQVDAILYVLAPGRGLGLRNVRVTVTDLTDGRHRAALREQVLDELSSRHGRVSFGFDDERRSGRGYYTDACFEIRATTEDGEDINLADGGFTRWTAQLLGNAKERLLIGGLGLERLCARRAEGGGQ
jgi:hypothetical protein